MFTNHIEGKIDPNIRTKDRKDRDLNNSVEEEDFESREVKT